jgi:L-lactate dehydrogenase complex protein LldG
MGDARRLILERIRTGLGRKELSQKAKTALALEIEHPARSLSPGRVSLSGSELQQEFIRMTTGEATTVDRVKHTEAAPEAVMAFLQTHDLPHAVVVAPDKAVRELSWETYGIRIRSGRARDNDLTSVTPAFAGIAETGCLMLISGPDHPYTLNFLPENQIVILGSDRIVPTPEDAFDMLRRDFGSGNLPRTVLMAAGPSRSADIGYSLQFGAHGPRRLHCILVG